MVRDVIELRRSNWIPRRAQLQVSVAHSVKAYLLTCVQLVLLQSRICRSDVCRSVQLHQVPLHEACSSPTF